MIVIKKLYCLKSEEKDMAQLVHYMNLTSIIFMFIYLN